jgi:hypothetical protein
LSDLTEEQRRKRDEFFRDLEWSFRYPWTRDDFNRKYFGGKEPAKKKAKQKKEQP